MKARRRGPWIIPEERKIRQEQMDIEDVTEKHICPKCNKLFIRKGNYENHVKVCNE
jgi:uncharacterized C2H2 Zn-finger protein